MNSLFFVVEAGNAVQFIFLLNESIGLHKQIDGGYMKLIVHWYQWAFRKQNYEGKHLWLFMGFRVAKKRKF